ncbi:MAG: hypothetical protein HZA93_28575 [Verrucomicrobia bacterium]|nr:hypothetical protein [Verrucomicrobiota bacterium]
MPTLATRKPKAKSRATRAGAKTLAKRRGSRGPSFGEWARKVSGMMKDGPPDLSMREGFGD